MRCSTSSQCKVCVNIVTSTPYTSSPGLMRVCTFSIDCISNATPRSAKNSAATGMITPSAAVSAFTVSRPRDGWQSTMITSYSSFTWRSTPASICSRPTSVTSCTSAADRSMLAGMMSRFSKSVWRITSCTSMRGLNSAVYTVSSTVLALMPSPTVAAPCGSKSTISTRRPYWLSAPAILMELVVLPTPPF